MYILNGKLFDIRQRQVVGDTQYPADWFEDADAREAVGIHELHPTTAPAITEGQRLNLVGYVCDEDGRWVSDWIVTELTVADLAQQAADLVQMATDLKHSADAAIAVTYADVDAVYSDAVGQRGPEYTDAETDARAFVAAGYAGTPSPYVSDFAAHNPTGAVQSNQWAADNIIARADAFKSAKLAMRTTRFVRQAEMRAATSAADLDAAVAKWKGFIVGLRAALGL